MKLRIRLPLSYAPERAYIMQVLLGTFLGIPYEIVREDRTNTVLRLAGDDQRELAVADGLFAVPDHSWLTAATIPRAPVALWAPPPLLRTGLRHEHLPVLFGAPSDGAEFANIGSERLHLGVDIFGGAFFFLTRYEEAASTDRDSRMRYPARASFAYRSGLLHRPIVNEYVELLWAALSYLWPSLKRKRREFRILPTHDVDRPFCVLRRSTTHVGRQIAGDIFRRKDLQLAGRRLRSRFAIARHGPRADICHNFDWIMAESERRGLRSSFYFLHRSADAIDSDYAFTDSLISDLLLEVHARGHEIGLHPTYASYLSAEIITQEFRKLRDATERLGIRQSEWGGRQHYLRWEAPTTWQRWADAGLTYDSTVGFADAAGFRCGTCYEYPVFNVRTRQANALNERPLVAMETALLPEGAGATRRSAVLETLKVLIDECRHFAGDFILLWHNSRLLSVADRNLYLAALDYAIEK